MIYRFRSRNDADVVMTQPVAERVLQAIGKDLSPEGIVTVEQMSAALAALQAAVQADETARAGVADDDAHGEREGGQAGGGMDAVSLRRRVWPLVEMLRRAQADGTPVTWHA